MSSKCRVIKYNLLVKKDDDYDDDDDNDNNKEYILKLWIVFGAL